MKLRLGTNTKLFIQIYDFTLDIKQTAAYMADAHSTHQQISADPIALSDLVKEKLIDYNLVNPQQEYPEFDSKIQPIGTISELTAFNHAVTNARMKFMTSTYTMWFDPQDQHIYFQRNDCTKGYFAGDALLLRDIIYLESVGVPFLDQ